MGYNWTKRSELDKEAGVESNVFDKEGYDEEWIIKLLANYIHELGHFPTPAEIRIKRRKDKDFPSHGVYDKIRQHEKAKKVTELLS